MARKLTISREAEVTAPLDLRVRTANGRVNIRGSERTIATVTVTIEMQGGWHGGDDLTEEDVDRVSRGIVFDGQRVFVDSPDTERHTRRALKLDYEIEVPQDTKVDLRLANGPADVRNVAGPAEVHVVNGPLILRDIAGAIEADVMNGPLRAARCGSGLEAKVTNGPLNIEQTRGPLKLGVMNGPIHIEDVAAGIKAEVMNGPINYTGPVKGNFDLSARNGPLTLRLPAGSRFEIDAEAERGTVHSDFQVSEDGGSGPEGSYRLLLRTHRGDIHLRESARVTV